MLRRPTPATPGSETTVEAGPSPVPTAATSSSPRRTAAQRTARRVWFSLRLDLTGLAVAGVFFAWSLTPSLLPREWHYQGLTSGISLAAGYGAGVVLSWFIRSVILPLLEWPSPPRKVVWWIRGTVGTGTLVLMLSALVAAAGWQNEITSLLGMEGTTTTGFLRTGALSIGIAAVIILVVRALRTCVRLVGKGIRRLLHLPEPLVNAVGIIVVAAMVITLVDGVLVRGFVTFANSAFAVQNETMDPRVIQPAEPERSGSPESLVPWDTLGREGRRMVAGGLRAPELETALGRPAVEPIRAYVGLDSAETQEERVALAIEELRRSGAFEREVLVVATTTGTGWINPNAMQSLELMYRGDTAFVGVQYSFLPSALSFLVDRDVAAEAGRALFDGVHQEWLRQDPETRPRLYVYGESLGSFGSEAAFDGLADLRARVSGALWIGPVNSNPLWRSLTERRDPGSPEIRPTYAGGLVVRFANRREDLVGAGVEAPWLEPRVLYIQHPSDPVVWWSPDLLFQRPDWLREPPGYDVSPSIQWRPIVTFWQISSDLANAARIPHGHGHLYSSVILDGWLAIGEPQGWTAADTAQAHEVLRSISRYQTPRHSPIGDSDR
ncbi:alpha/beta-hydrolase family protein [Hoyosella sp. YIM 151337]|uniref:alpha/beta hydrolase n=1 Tax=Hoyosella sp. YIM 151337 TaxID=2992742 RepID=UPI00223593A2|nr:alpha/beta-hydrolase family protein [Hoyosella sp. YIM 151337]MCW4354913.1 alpha/beta-hydrolase family protein [Hoyosella sp. YIM 151337]